MSGVESLMGRYLRIPPRSQADKTLRLLVRMGVMVAGADEGSLLVHDEQAGDLRFAMTVGSEASEAKLLGQRVPLGKGITGLAAASREVHIGAPTFKDVQQTELHTGSHGPEAVIAAPMLIEEQLVGVITAVSFQPGHRFSAEVGRLFGGFAAIAGVLVDQAQRLSDAGRDIAGPMGGGPVGAGAEAHIVAAVARLAQQRPRALAQIAALIDSIEALIEAQPPG
jgi:transcriptional regulator with GAF, ATPase, and Fis domain